MQHVSTRAGAVAFESQGSGPPLVLLHSVGHDHHDFDDVVPELAKHFRTIAVDWPGHGASDMFDPPTSATTAGMCDALEDVVTALRLPPALLLGNSVGGTAALRLAARRPDRVRALVLVDNGGLAGRSALVRAFCWLQGREAVRRATGMAFARAYFKTRGPGVDRALARIAAARKRPGFVAMDAAMWRSFGAPESDLTDLAPDVTCPTLVVWGRRDPVLRAQVEGARTRALIPGAAYAELDTGHVPFVEDPRAFLDVVLPYLRAHAERPLEARA
jgi:pimeloyl-ACP methyl ester carboxylesterase